MDAVRECLEEFCAKNSPKTDVNLWVGRIYGPIKPKRSAKKANKALSESRASKTDLLSPHNTD